MPAHPWGACPGGDSFVVNPESPQAVGLAAWWPPLASRGTALARDLAGTGLDAAPQGDAVLSLDGEQGWAWALDGSGDYLTPGDPASGALDFGTGSFSICAWVKASVLSGDLFRSILSKRTSTNFVGWSLFVWRSGHPTLANRVGFEAASSHAGPYYDATADAALPLDTWVHVIGVVDRAAGETRLYLNGVKQATTASTAGLGSVDNSTAVEIGRESGISTWNGRIADVRIYRVAVDDRLAWQLWAPESRWDLYRLLGTSLLGLASTGTAYVQNLSETLTLTDGRTLAAAKALAETLALTDTRALAAAKALAETVSLSDAAQLALVLLLALSETLPFSDSGSRGAGKGLAESLTLTEARALGASLIRSESLDLTESRSLAAAKVLSDALSLSDARAFGLTKALAEALSLSDLVDAFIPGPGAALVLQLAESLTLADQLAVRVALLRYLATLERIPKPVADLLLQSKPVAELLPYLKPVAGWEN